MARRARGDGSVYYDASKGRYLATIEVGRDPETGKRRRRKVSASTRVEVRDKLDELRQEMRKAGTVGRGDVTVAQVVADFIANPPAAWRSSITMSVYHHHAARITAALGTVPVVKLTPRQVETMLSGLARAGLSTSTISRTRTTLKWALRRAMRDGLVTRNVAELADAPRGTRRESRSMTRAQIGQLLSHKMTPWWRAYLLTAIGCGLRPGELLGLRWADVDLDAGVISVRTALHNEPGRDGRITLTIAQLKSPSARRTLRMPAQAVAGLRALRAEQAAARLAAGARWQDNGLVFCGPTGKPMWPEGVRARFRRLCKAAGLGSDWHPHEQRHTFVSVLSEAGIPIESISEAAGHRSVATTRAVYLHAISPEIATAAQAMNPVLGASPEEAE